MCDKAQLGFATTRELLLELKARGQTENYYHDLGMDVALGADHLLDELPGSMLDYSTVEANG